MVFMKNSAIISELDNKGFATVANIYSVEEIGEILDVIHNADSSKETFRKSGEVFAIRQFLKEIPATLPLVFNDKLKELIKALFGDTYFVVKSIYFDKPETSNWYVSYHQDLTISVDKKIELKDFGPWTVKNNQFAVQPPVNVLENIFTIRIHLDNTDEENGALRVLPTSHLQGVCRPDTIDWSIVSETICCVPEGGIMLMRPLLLHSSGRTTNHKRRRVIHIEFSNVELPGELHWSERIDYHHALI